MSGGDICWESETDVVSLVLTAALLVNTGADPREDPTSQTLNSGPWCSWGADNGSNLGMAMDLIQIILSLVISTNLLLGSARCSLLVLPKQCRPLASQLDRLSSLTSRLDVACVEDTFFNYVHWWWWWLW